MTKPFILLEILYKLGFKKLMLIIFSISFLVIPEDMLHMLAVILHTGYESIAFIVEAMLMHGAGLNKFQAQIVVFYTSLGIGALGVLAFIRGLPRMIKAARKHASQWYTKARADLLTVWQALGFRRKTELIFLQFLGVFSMMVFLLS